MSRHETFFTEEKGRSVRLSPTTKFGRVIWVVEGAGGANQPKIWRTNQPIAPGREGGKTENSQLLLLLL